MYKSVIKKARVNKEVAISGGLKGKSFWIRENVPIY